MSRSEPTNPTPRAVPEVRLRRANQASPTLGGGYVLYWMVANRRLSHNFALDRAVEWARHLRKPLVILEPLRCAYRWASDRIHQFVLDGMAEHERRLANGPVLYYPYVERRAEDGKGLLEELSLRACVVVTDDNPCFFLPRMLGAAATRIAVRIEAVDSYGLMPLRASERFYPTAYGYRRFLQRELPAHLAHAPRPRPLAGSALAPAAPLPESVTRRWPKASLDTLRGHDLDSIAIDHGVARADLRGGSAAARRRWRGFREQGLDRYLATRRNSCGEGTSGLSPYLHFGHISTHEIFWDHMDSCGWSVEDVDNKPAGHREGWWHIDPPAEAFLDQLITWREVAANAAVHLRDFDRYATLPEWARRTLDEHESDPRVPQYTRGTLEAADTHDDLWNATQRQLVHEGRIHNALRMLWGKKILEWSSSPRAALRTMLHLNNKYALDGRDPNSVAGIFWVLGRYDRPWGPERPVFGKVRFMSSINMARKLRTGEYVRRYAKPA
ncbi:MAG: cryptochrome/DNA photolyase family protein [Planctomycetota bacterium]|jgi:deoxyribodipyrimidine photo-lyase